MYLTPEKELYTIIQQYYSGKYSDITSLDLDAEFDFSNVLYDIEAHFYKIRSYLILEDYSNAAELLNIIEKKIISNNENNLIDSKTSNLLINDVKILNSFIDFKKLNLIDHELLNSIDNNTPSLALIYKKIIESNSKISISSPDLDLESFIYLLFLNSNIENKEIDLKIIKNLKSHYSDSLILDFAIAWLGLSKSTIINDDDSIANIKNSYYFFDELSSSSNTDSIKNTINLLACQLKLGNIPEALECIEKLKSFNEKDTLKSWNYSLLINKIALESIKLNSVDRLSLIEKIKKDFPESSYVKDLNEKDDLFTSIVSTYN
ncbi:hypothetical protein C6P40_005492 [Pichia californica]|uniref:Coatomer subunit epsilon n=1 Tax=Pichia californica TaxID=460514 RepID=A0A9P6WLD4_9ASCO|nr:hypothetical protein C6P42_000725 [[Candida] californica]KAG0689157.1 hypothetical protein C6P40_005492 [[Candida] californica]